MGKLLIERGHVAMLLSEDTTDKAKKEAKVAEARAAFAEAHEAYAKAIEPLKPRTRNMRASSPTRPAQGRARRDLRDAPGCDAAKGRCRLRAGPDLPRRLAPNGPSR